MRTAYYVLLAPISRGTLPCAMHGHAPWLLAGSLHSSPAGAFAGTARNVLCPLQSVVPCTPLRCLVVDVGLSPLSKLDLSAQMHGFPNTRCGCVGAALHASQCFLSRQTTRVEYAGATSLHCYDKFRSVVL